MKRSVVRCGLLLTILALVGCATQEARRNDGRIEEASFVAINGIQQWVSIRGDNRRNPVLLFVHGGPADPQSALVETYAPFERDFVFVQWDQRGAGKTFAANRQFVKELTLEKMAQDGVELAGYLSGRFQHRKIIVLGHSWGSTLATAMVLRKPTLFSAYVGTGQVSSWRASATAQWEYLRLAATAAKDKETLDRMATIGNPDFFDAGQYFSWRNIMNRKYLGAADSGWLRNLRSMAADKFSDDERKDLGESGALSAAQLMKVMMTTDLGVTANQMPVPFYVIQGRDDLYTPTAPAIEYFDSVRASRKELIIIEGAGHFAVATHTKEFLQALTRVGLRRSGE